MQANFGIKSILNSDSYMQNHAKKKKKKRGKETNWNPLH